MTESYFIYFLQACFTRYRDHQGVDLNLQGVDYHGVDHQGVNSI